MTLQVEDNFTGSSGTDLAAHTPDTDVQAGGWNDDAANNCELDGSGNAVFTANDDDSYIDVGSADQWVELSMSKGGNNSRFAVHLRNGGLNYPGSGSDSIGYQFYHRASSNQLYLYRVVGSTFTEVDTTSWSASASTFYKWEAVADGTSFSLDIDDTNYLSGTDSGITTGNNVDIACVVYNVSSPEIDYIKIWDADPAAGGSAAAPPTGSMSLLGVGL